MDDKRLDDQLELLKKSYDRMPKYLDVDALMDKIEEEEKAPVVQKPKRRLALWGTTAAAAAAMLFAGGVLIGPMLSMGGESPEMEPRTTIQNEQVAFTSEESTLSIEQLNEWVQQTRQQTKQQLGLPADVFNALSFVQEADAHAAFYEETPAAYVQNEDRVFTTLSFAYATPSQMLQHISSDVMTKEEVMYDFLLRIKEVKTAYQTAYDDANEDMRRDIAQAAKVEGIYFVDEEAVFRYDKFEDFYVSDLEYFGLIRGFLAMAQFDEPLYEVDDLRYAPQEIFPHFRELTIALLTVDYAPLADMYESQFIVAVLRLLQGTDQYPLTEASITEFLAQDEGVFTPIAKTILAELQQSGTSQTAAALTYDELLQTFQAARIPYSAAITHEEYWEPTTAELARFESWDTLPDNILLLSGKEMVLYYVYAMQQNNEDVLAIFHHERDFQQQSLNFSNIRGIQLMMYGDDAVIADMTLHTNDVVSMSFLKVDGLWQRMQ